METALGLKALGAGIAFGLAALSTGFAQSKIGSAAVGAISEKREVAGLVIGLLVIPELLVIFGFVIAILIMGAK